MKSDVGIVPGGPVVGLRERRPGHAVIHALCTKPGAVRTRGRLARFFGVRPLSRDGYAWYRGALGEIAVGGMLSRLDSAWVVLHAVPVGRRGSDIDHVVVGPAGVFTVNTKNHAGKRVWVAGGTFLVSGFRKDYIRNSEFEARRTEKLLGEALGWSVPVRPVIAVLDPQRLTIKGRPAEVEVVEARCLVRRLTRMPAVLDPESVARVVSVIGEPATWRHPTDESAGVEYRQQFDAVRAMVRAVRGVRIAWASVMVAAAVATAVLVGPELFGLLTIAITALLGGSA